MRVFSLFVIATAFILQLFSMDYKRVFAGELLDKIQETHKLILCAGPYAWPYTSSTNYPRGFDIEIMERIAANEDRDGTLLFAKSLLGFAFFLVALFLGFLGGLLSGSSITNIYIFLANIKIKKVFYYNFY